MLLGHYAFRTEGENPAARDRSVAEYEKVDAAAVGGYK